MAATAYSYAYTRERARLLRGAPTCHRCGAPATEADHMPAISQHRHREGSGCCRLLPACAPCQRAQGGLLADHGPAPAELVVDVEAGIEGRPASDTVWRVPWLADLIDGMPDSATWPRFMTVPHPDAAGSYGAGAVEWLQTVGGIKPRWWQALALTRQLEHDGDGRLVWLEVLDTTSRQSGKSVLLRAGAAWRLHQTGLFDEQQLIMHTAKDLQIAREVRREAKAWAQSRGYPTREVNGSEEITEPASGSRWLVRGKNSTYGYSVGYALADEAWGLPVAVIDDGLQPTMLERQSPQLVLASTAHRKATPLFPERRAQALQELDAPQSTLLLEWSAPRTADIDDLSAWRQASPHWSAGRQRLLESRIRRVQSGESLDPDEDDPVESFRCQYLNHWPARAVHTPGEPLIDLAQWMQARGTAGPDARLFAAIEDWFGKGCAVAVVARDGELFEVDAWTADSWEAAVADVAAVYAGREHGRLLLGPSMWDRIGGSAVSARCVHSTDTRSGLALFRQMFGAGRIVHDSTHELDAQLLAVKVRELSSGMNLVPGGRNDLVKATVWALQAAHRQRIPAIH